MVTKINKAKKTVVKVDPATVIGTPEWKAHWEQWVKEEIEGKHAN